jgi:hypothetical protein
VNKAACTKELIFILAGISLILTSCNDLDVTPKSTLVTTTYFKTLSDAQAAIAGVYSSLSYNATDLTLYGGTIPYLADLTTDYMTTGQNASSTATRALGSKSYDAANQRIYLAWTEIYKGIDRANVAIDNIPSVTGNGTTKRQYINEARFIRALLYFNAVRFWGAVPLVLHEPTTVNASELQVSRASVNDVYAQIISDLDSAATYLPTSYSGSDLGRATSGAAKALLAKVYLTRGDWANAITYAKAVINGPYGYALFDNYYDNFDPAKKNGKEEIFSVQFAHGQAADGTTSGFTVATHCYFSTGFSNATTPVAIISDTTKFYNIFSDNDQRKYVNYAKKLYNPKTSSVFTFTLPRFRKWLDTTIVTTYSLSAPNFTVIRYSDVLLTLAEAINEQSGPTAEAYDAINKVIRRAYKNSTAYDLSGLSQDQFRESLRVERYKEFAEEGQRWFDLVRWKILVKSLSGFSSASKRLYLFPIPTTERASNPNLWQNWGWDGASISDPYDASFQ